MRPSSCRSLLRLLAALLIAAAVPVVIVAQEAPPQELLDGFEWRNIGPLRGGRTQTVAGHPDRPFEYFFGATVKAGLNRFSWNMRYAGATTFEGMIIWSGRPQRGPKAPPGSYAVRLTVGDETRTQPLEVRLDPRVVGVTVADLEEQWELAMRIRDATSKANEAVIRIREIKTSLEDREDDLTRSFVAALSEIEEDLYQVRNQSGQDPLNFPIKLNNRLASLRRSIENGDARPTDGAYQVFEELSLELEAHLTRLEELIWANQALVSE